MRALEVYLGGNYIGTIVESRRGARFSYDSDIYERFSGAPLLSLALPVKRKPFGESKTRNWFEGLLPEGDRRDRVCRQLGLDSYDWVGLLAEIGWECAGAVRVFPEADVHEHEGGYVPLGADALARRLEHVDENQLPENSGSFRMSLGGFQDKLCVYMPGLSAGKASVSPEGICLTRGDAPSTHILKPEPKRYPGLAESEAWAMTVARHATRCARVALLDLDGVSKTLVVERYDRALRQGGAVARLHQEDACQALDLPILNKYANGSEQKGDDPTYKGMAGLLDSYSADAEEEKRELLRQLTVNMALGNWDAHAKNTSFLYREPCLPVLAPLYDVVPISEVEPRTTLISLRENRSLEPASVDGLALLNEALSWGISATKARDVILKCLDDLESGLDNAAALYAAAATRHEKATQSRMARLRKME